jgi:hypothetical protein
LCESPPIAQELLVDRRFRGPSDSANGGYACGLVAGLIDPLGPVEATLRVPPPLDRPFQPREGEDQAELWDGETLVAEARAVDGIDLELPSPPSLEEAAEAGRHCPWADEHPYPECFACGPHREAPEGLHCLGGPVEGAKMIADVWTVDESHGGEGEAADPRIVWAALDCPTANGTLHFHPAEGLVLLGRLTAQIDRLPAVGEKLVATGWPVGRDGRKHFGGSALFDESGEPVAKALGLWIELK